MANFGSCIDLVLGFLINLFAYETIVFVFYILVSVPIMDSDKIEGELRDKLLDIGAVLGIAIVVFMMVLFITGSFRLIPV